MPEISDWAKGPFAFLGSIPAFTQGDYEKGVQGLVNSGGFIAFAAYRYKGDKETQEAFKVETKVLWYGILYIMSLQLLYLKATDTGKEYKTGKGDFDAAGQSLEAATAEDWGGWTGDGADQYNAQNDLQQTRAATMSGLDADVYDVLADETKQVKRAVMNLGWEQAGLTCMIPMCSLIYKTNPALSVKTQVTAVMCAVLASIDIVKGTINDSSDNAGKINKLRETYRQQGAAAATSLAELTSGTAATGDMGPTAKSTVDQFDTLHTTASFPAPSTEAAPRIVSAENVSAAVPYGRSPAYPVAGVTQVVSRSSLASAPAAKTVAPAKTTAAKAPAKKDGAAGAEGAGRAPIAVTADGAQSTTIPQEVSR
jgi:uncharacterized protein YukE